MSTSFQPRFRYTNEAVGLLFLVTLVLFAMAVMGSGRVRQLLDPGERLRVIMPADGLFGLSEGADVEILGTTAGKVMKIVIDPKQQIFAEVQIQEGMQNFIRRDSQAIIRKRYGVAGAAFLEITRGTGQPLDWDYAVITAAADRAPTETVADLIDEVHKRVLPVIDDTHAAIRSFAAVADDLKNPKGDLHKMLNNLNDIAGKIAGGEGTVGRLLAQKEMADNLERAIAEVTQVVELISPLLAKLTKTAGNVSALSARINEQAEDLPELSQSLQQVIASTQTVMADLSRTTPHIPRITRNIEDATANLPVLLLQTQQVAAELERLLIQLQSSWLLGGRSAGQEPPPSRISVLEVQP